MVENHKEFRLKRVLVHSMSLGLGSVYHSASVVGTGARRFARQVECSTDDLNFGDWEQISYSFCE